MAAAAATSTFSVPTKPPLLLHRRRPHGRPGVAGQLRISADCVVVGGGISGLHTVQALATRHAGASPEVLVTEARPRVGGNITTIERDGYLWEEAPNSFQASSPRIPFSPLREPEKPKSQDSEPKNQRQ